MRIVTEGGAIVGRHDRLTAVFRGPMRMRILDGSVDELGLWNRVLTSGEMTNLWNGGAGLTYPF